MNIRFGDIVKPIRKHIPLRHNNASIYRSAIVLSINPFVVASKDGNMRWYNVNPKYLAVIGIASVVEIGQCIHRLHS